MAPEALLVAHKDAPTKGIILSDTPFLIDKTCLFGHPNALPFSLVKTKTSGYQWFNRGVFREMAPSAGLEPATPGLEVPCSIQLSYEGG